MDIFDCFKKARPNDTRFDYMERMALPEANATSEAGYHSHIDGMQILY